MVGCRAEKSQLVHPIHTMNILHIILVWLGIFASYLLWAKIRENVRLRKKFWDFDNFNFLVGSLLVFLCLWLFVFVAEPEPKFNTNDEQITYGEATNQPWLITEALWEKIKEEPTNIDLHYSLVTNHYKQQDPKLTPPDPEAFASEENHLFTYYTDLSESPNDTLHDIGHIFLSAYSLAQPIPDYSGASLHLRLVNIPQTKYVNFYAGKIILLGAGASQAEEHFLSEIRNKGFKEGAYQYLSVIYDLQDRNNELRELVYSGASEFVPEDLRARVYYLEKDVASFYKLKFTSVFVGTNWWGVAGALAIMMIWLFFLWKIAFVSQLKVRQLFLPISIGAVLAMTSWWLYAFYKHGLGFWINGNIGNDILFCFAGIGIIEELVKLIPFLIILHFTGIIKKPIDYLLVASACGLGFAFFENLLYIANYGLDVIHSRALTASVSHMACSAIVAYGFVLHKFRWPNRWWLIPIFFLLASAAHGFYDFWLLNPSVQSFSILTLIFYLSEILVYISFLNNALNQSVDASAPPNSIAFNSRKLTSVLAGSLVLLFAFEYFATCIVYGTTYGNNSMTSAFLSAGYLLFFLSVRMSQIRVEPGKWKAIDFLSGLLPSQLLESGRNRNATAVIGAHLRIESVKESGLQNTQFPLEITVTKNIVVNGAPNWYEASCNSTFEIKDTVVSTIYIQPKREGEFLMLNEKTEVGIYVREETDGAKNTLFVGWGIVQAPD